MNKKVLAASLSTLVLMAGCSGATADVSEGSEKLMTVGDVTYTKEDVYTYMKKSSGPSLTMQMAEEWIYDTEIGRDEDVLEEAQQNYDDYAATSEDLESYVKSMGYADKEDYIDQVIVPSIQASRLLEKWFDDDSETIIADYKPSKAQIIQTADQDSATKALAALKEGKTATEVFAQYGNVESSYNGDTMLVTTVDTSLPTRLINSLAAAKNPGVLDEVFSEDEGIYFVAVLTTNDYEDLKSELISTLKNDSSVTESCLIFYLTKYDFQVYDQDIFDYLKANYPQYLVSRPDLMESDS